MLQIPDDLIDAKAQTKSGVQIHPTAMVARQAKLGKDVVIGPNAIVGPKVELGDAVILGAGAIVQGKTKVGARTHIYPYATVGSTPQDLKYAGEETELFIGEANRIREYVNVSLGTVGGGGKTVIGNNNLIMVYTHIAHDCIIADNCIFANSVQMAGHVVVGNHVVFGGMSGAHQFCRFGDMAMVGAAAVVVQDVPPYCMVQGDRARINGLNVVGLRRAGITGDKFRDVKNIYRLVYSENLTIEDAIAAILKEVPEGVERQKFVEFLKQSERGICR